MKFLAIDTSTATASVALGNRSGGAEKVMDADCRQSAMIIDAIKCLLEAQNCTLDGVSGISCIGGPGSFTGLRVGICTAKALSYGKEKPLYLVSSLQALAWQAGRQGITGNVCVMMDARNDQVFAGCYRLEEGREPKALMPDEAGNVIEMRDKALTAAGGGCAFGGTGVFAHIGDFGGITVIEGLDRPSALAASALADFYAAGPGDRSSDPMTAAPEYLRVSQAERAAKERSNG